MDTFLLSNTHHTKESTILIATLVFEIGMAVYIGTRLYIQLKNNFPVYKNLALATKVRIKYIYNTACSSTNIPSHLHILTLYTAYRHLFCFQNLALATKVLIKYCML